MSHSPWITEGFEAFRRGRFGNGGQNLYVSRKGVLQRIYQYDLNHNGYFDLVFANCQNHHESAESYVYAIDGSQRDELLGQGALAGLVADLTGNGWNDIVLAGYYDMAAPFATTDIYFGGPGGYSENRHIRIPTPWSEDACCGRFRPGAKPALAFIMPNYRMVRLFEQGDCGFTWRGYADLPIAGNLVCAADLDGDGCDELIVRDKDGTETRVYWGGPDGIDPLRCTILPALPDSEILQPEEEKSLQSNLEKKFEAPRLLQKVRWNGRDCFTLSTGKKVLFYTADACRVLHQIFSIDVPMALAVAVGDLDGDGLDDLAFACRVRNPDDIDRQCSFIWLNRGGQFLPENRIAVDTRQACTVDIRGNRVLFGSCAAGRAYTNDSLLFTFEGGKFNPEPTRLEGEDTRRAFLIENPDGVVRALLINHYSRSCVGYDHAFVYWGGPDGYSPDRMLPVPGWCAVDSLSADLDDDGWAELLIGNNSENSLHLDPGHHLHHFGPDGFQPERTVTLKTDLGWGVVAGDFNHDGYLEVITPCDHWQNLRIFYGKDYFQTYDTIDLKGVGSPRWLCAADLNGNGWLDLVVPVISAERSIILWGGPDGFSFDRRQELAVFRGVNATVADLSRNGYPDIIIAGHVETPSHGDLRPREPHHSYLNIYWGGPDGYSDDNKTMLRADAGASISVADFNRDGWLDVFCGSYHGGVDRDINSFLYWNRNGHFRELDRQLLYTHSASGCVAADFNNDGWVDLAIANHKVDGDHHGYSCVWWNGEHGFNEERTTRLPTEGPHGMTAVNPGNILTRGPEEFYYSEPLELTKDAVVESIDIDADIPPQTWVKATVRVGDGEWHAPEGFAAPKGARLQYRLEIGATNSLRSPRITKVTVNFK